MLLIARHVVPEGYQGLHVAVVDQEAEVGLLGCFLVFVTEVIWYLPDPVA